MPVDLDRHRAARQPITFRELSQRGDLDRRTANLLRGRGLLSIQDAARFARPELELLSGVGPVTSAKVERLAQRHGLSLPAARHTCPATGRRINQAQALKLRLAEIADRACQGPSRTQG